MRSGVASKSMLMSRAGGTDCQVSPLDAMFPRECQAASVPLTCTLALRAPLPRSAGGSHGAASSRPAPSVFAVTSTLTACGEGTAGGSVAGQARLPVATSAARPRRADAPARRSECVVSSKGTASLVRGDVADGRRAKLERARPAPGRASGR